MSAAPDLSILLVTDELATVRDVLASLSDQSASDRLEVVLVGQAERLDVDGRVRDEFAAVRVVPVADIGELPRARAAGVRAATAPVVLVGETHSYPQPGWAEALIEAHRGPWTAVGPAIVNANPQSAIAWSNVLLDYGLWLDPAQGGPAEHLPGHNTAFKRSALLEYGPGLETMLESDTELLANLRARGHLLYLEPRARTAHLNVSRPGPWLRERVAAGRDFAGLRSRRWSPLRRAAYALGSPLIPVVRLARVVGQLRARRALGLLPRVLPALAVGLAFSAAGEAAGYAAGRGSPRSLYEMELHKVRYVAS